MKPTFEKLERWKQILEGAHARRIEEWKLVLTQTKGNISAAAKKLSPQISRQRVTKVMKDHPELKEFARGLRVAAGRHKSGLGRPQSR